MIYRLFTILTFLVTFHAQANSYCLGIFQSLEAPSELERYQELFKAIHLKDKNLDHSSMEFDRISAELFAADDNYYGLRLFYRSLITPRSYEQRNIENLIREMNSYLLVQNKLKPNQFLHIGVDGTLFMEDGSLLKGLDYLVAQRNGDQFTIKELGEFKVTNLDATRDSPTNLARSMLRISNLDKIGDKFVDVISAIGKPGPLSRYTLSHDYQRFLRVDIRNLKQSVHDIQIDRGRLRVKIVEIDDQGNIKFFNHILQLKNDSSPPNLQFFREIILHNWSNSKLHEQTAELSQYLENSEVLIRHPDHTMESNLFDEVVRLLNDPQSSSFRLFKTGEEEPLVHRFVYSFEGNEFVFRYDGSKWEKVID